MTREKETPGPRLAFQRPPGRPPFPPIIARSDEQRIRARAARRLAQLDVEQVQIAEIVMVAIARGIR